MDAARIKSGQSLHKWRHQPAAGWPAGTVCSGWTLPAAAVAAPTPRPLSLPVPGWAELGWAGRSAGRRRLNGGPAHRGVNGDLARINCWMSYRLLYCNQSWHICRVIYLTYFDGNKSFRSGQVNKLWRHYMMSTTLTSRFHCMYCPSKWKRCGLDHSVDGAKILHRLLGILCTLLTKITGLGQVADFRRHLIGTNSYRFFTEVIFSATSLVAIGWDGHMCDLGQKNSTYERLHLPHTNAFFVRHFALRHDASG